MSNPRFVVQESHTDGLALLDQEKGATVIASVSSRSTLRALESIANCLNAATSERPDDIPSACQTSPALSWRAIEYLSSLYRQERDRANELEGSARDQAEKHRYWHERYDKTAAALVRLQEQR